MTADAAILMDRFVSASSATDAHDSLQALLDGLKSRNEETRIDASLIYQDTTVLDAFITVLATSAYKDMTLEEGPLLVCRIYQELWRSDGAATVLLKEPSPGRLVESLLDVVSNLQQTDYTRVLGLQLLNHVCTKAPSTAQSQLLSTPNGLHRLADLFSENNDAVRNELLGGVAQQIAKWASCAKIWVFGEVCDVLMTIAMNEGGLTSGHVLVKDCLELVESLVDPTLADLIWQSPIVAPKLASLLDLRGGTEFINPPKPTVSQSDDLDDILATGNKKQVEQVLPKLTYNEEDVVVKVLSILGILLENAESRPAIWKQHGPLCSLVWELALVSKPPSGTKPVCALPSPKLQQVALETTSEYFHDPATMKQHFGVDRLLFIVCTGGGSPTKWEAKLGLSQAALHVLRRTLPEDEAREILTHTLAPPMNSADNDDGKPPSPTVVQKLLNTVFENMQESDTKLERRRINLLGALGALSVFIRSPTDKEIMLGISSSLVDTLLQCLEQQDDTVVRMALLRFACEWVVEAPTVVQAFLASSHSIVLSILLGSPQKEVGTMVGFLLGLLMQFISGDDQQHGGWTKKSIMELLSKRKGGISGYTTDLEQLKKTDLPWKACALEWQLFIKWYSAQVLAIRRCVVHELTSGGETDEDEDEIVGNGTSNASTKSLNRLVSQQAAELEELRVSLTEAKATIESQEGKLTVWKRRVESTPTQLDEMLSEYTDKNAQMEKEVSSLNKEMQEKESEHNALLKERDDQINQLQATVQEWQTRELESRQERDDLRGEVQGLTSAYATLEQEYNRRDGADAQGAAPTGEDPAQQREGEVSHQNVSSSAELATLRAENARLRSDAQAADDWMAMAVQRMNDIGGQNQSLQQEVATLQGQLQEAQLTGGFVAPVATGVTQEQLDEERQHREQVEQQLVESTAVSSKFELEISALRQQLEDSSDRIDSNVVEELKRRLANEEVRRQELETKLESAQTDTTTAMDSLGDSKSERERLERAVASLQDELQVARSEMAALREERDGLDRNIESKDGELESMRSLLSSKDVEIVGLSQQLSESRDSVGAEIDTDSQELVSLRESVQSLSASLEKTRQELDETASREREEIQRRDERIRELESSSNQVQSRDQPPSNAAGSFGDSGDTDSRDDEIKSLREANEAAQEWMAKAVEHHQMLSDQVSALTEDKAALTKEINDLQQSTSAPSQSLPDASNETINQLKRDLSDRTTELTDLGAKIIKLESEVRIKETEMAGVQERIARCDELQAEVDSLQLAKDAEVEKALELEKGLAKIVSEKEELSVQIDVLRQDLDEKERLVALSASTQSEETEALRELLRERESAIVGLREELEGEKDALAAAGQARLLLQESKDEGSRLRADLEEAQSSLASMKDKTASFEQLQAEVESLRETSSSLEKDRNLLDASNTDVERLRDEIASTKSELETLTEERDSLRENVSQLETQLSEFQTWANAAQEKIAELQNEKDIADQASKSSLGAESSKDADTGSVDGLRDEIVSVKRGLTDAITERDALKETVSGLESRLLEFQTWADAAQEKITELETEKGALEEKAKELAEPDIHANSEETGGLREEIASAKNEIASLASERDDLKGTLTEMESQLSEFQSWSDAAQLKISELETEKEDLEEKAKELADSAKDSDDTVVDSLREEIASTKSELVAVTTERDALKKNVSEIETQLSELQSWSDTAQLKISELQQEKDASEQEMEKVVDFQKETTEKLESLREEMDMKSFELSNLSAEKNELQEANANLVVNLERTKLENDNLYAKNNSLEQDIKVLETHCNDQLERSNKTDAQLKEKEDALLVAEASITELQAALENLQEESAGIVDEWKAQVEELESTTTELEEALQEQQAEASDAVEQWSARWSELDALKSQLETKLETLASERDDLAESLQRERENGGREMIDRIKHERNIERAEWNAEREAMKARIDDQNESLRENSQNLTAASEELAQTRTTAELTVDAWKDRVSELEDTIGQLEQELSERRDEAAEAIAQWETHCAAVEARVQELENELLTVAKENEDVKLSMERSLEPLGEQLERERASRASLEEEKHAILQELDQVRLQSEDVIDQWKARAEELESTLNELENQLEAQQEEATKAISQWESSYSALETKASQLEEDLVRSTEAADRSMNDELREPQEEILTLKNQVERLQKQLARNASSQERIRELESSLAADQQTLKEAQANLTNKQELVESLETQLIRIRQEIESNATETSTALEIERAAKESAERDLAALQETVSETEEAFATLCSKEDQIFSEGSQSKEDADKIRQLLQEKESEWHEERGTLIQELDDLKATAGELEEELRDASDALQACVTDEISEKAAEVASQALRYQIEQLRSQAEREQEAYARERNLRLAAEEEVEALKTDLINVLGYIDESGDTAAEVQRFTMQASEAMQRREREELDEIRKALERALQDLASAQAAERKALEDAASSRLQLTVCEQEVLAAKSDLAFLTQTLEESREAEASKAASLEYRISSLEDDREVLRQFHEDELENLRNELTHVSMEKDRILHSLKESEKKNAAIVFSTSKTSESDGSSSPEAELSRLRVEKAQLLTAAAEEGSRTEGRILEAVAAHVSSMEADIILERELRVAAEAAVEDIKFQMETLKEADRDEENREPTDENINDSRSESFLDELTAELKQFKEENRVVSAENDKLREELETANEKSRVEIAALTDKWRRAQAKVHMLESADHFDAEVKVEVAKLRSYDGEGGEHPRNWIVVHENDNPARDETPPVPSPVETYDLVRQQKIAIQEERAMYLELLAEHDDLLALLAQQDLEKASLNAALSRVAGPEAVRAAMTDAEENAVKKYGKYLKLSS